MGGDEFVVVAPGLAPKDVTDICKRLEGIAEDVGRALCEQGTLSASIGRSFYPDDGTEAEGLLVAADRSMYHVKESRRGDMKIHLAASAVAGGHVG
jgi:diguanylate cyclase (GGDEF)-like protein